MKKFLLLSFLIGCSALPHAGPEPGLKWTAAPKVLAAGTPSSVAFSWSWTQAAGTPDIVGFKLMTGASPGVYSTTTDIPDKTARTFTLTAQDLSRLNYAAMVAYTSFGILSAPSPELVYGGQPTPPFQLKAAPASP